LSFYEDSAKISEIAILLLFQRMKKRIYVLNISKIPFQMKLHRSLTDAVVTTLQEVFVNKRQADRAIEYILKSNKKWGARDRGFIAENTYEIVRWWRLLTFVIDAPAAIEDLERTHFYHCLGAWLLLKERHAGYEASLRALPEWTEFESLDVKTMNERYEEARQTRKIIESIPDWMDELCEKELGTAWDKELMAMNEPAPVVLRANTLKTNRSYLQDLLEEEEIESSINNEAPDAVILRGRPNVFRTEFFKEGFFEVQDTGSQLIAPFLDVQPGMRVIDACAGAGGKTLHLAALLQNKGRIISMDVEERKLLELQKRAKRAGATNIETKLIEGKTIKRLQDSADRLLLDVPCSGLGVLRRNPDAKWKITPEFIDNLRLVQWDILSRYSAMLKKGGKMVFATCSILPSESENHVQRLLAEQPDKWELLKEHRTSPAEDGYDGFYMACLLKK
jgi:16S rRNA (cytosine967-C5)-methyltransferase